ncbi:MAG: hypothetical protein AAF800_03690 [Planctomycetota bacterium]
MNLRRLAAVNVLAVVSVTGCISPADRTDTPRSGDGLQLRVDGTARMLGQANLPAGSPEVFGRELTAMVQQQRFATAEGWLRHRRDESERLLVSPGDTPPEVLSFLAARWDERAGGRGGWRSLLEDRLARPEAYADFDAAYRDWQGLVRGGRFDLRAAEKVGSPAGAPAPWLDVESYRLQAIALLTTGDPSGAADRWVSAAALAEPWSPRAARTLRLMAANAWLSDQRFDLAAAAWGDATRGMTLSELDSPATLALLIQAEERLRAAAGPAIAPLRPLYHRLGQIRLSRGEPQSALVAFRAAESQLGPSPTTPALRLAQADALTALRQYDAARSVLVGLTDSPERVNALARLGVIELRAGRVGPGVRLLRTASQEAAIEDHPRVHADYALALLASGRTPEGLALSAQAREHFRRRDDFDAIKRSLQNQQVMAQAQGLNDQAGLLGKELQQLETGKSRRHAR